MKNPEYNFIPGGVFSHTPLDQIIWQRLFEAVVSEGRKGVTLHDKFCKTIEGFTHPRFPFTSIIRTVSLEAGTNYPSKLEIIKYSQASDTPEGLGVFAYASATAVWYPNAPEYDAIFRPQGGPEIYSPYYQGLDLRSWTVYIDWLSHYLTESTKRPRKSTTIQLVAA